MKLTWKKVKGADGYILYGAQYGKSLKKIASFSKASKVSYTHKKLKAKSYYKYMVLFSTLNDTQFFTLNETILG